MEKIEVGYAAAFLVGGLGIKHKYIVYTDSNGQQFYARGGPGYFGPGAAQGGRNELALSVFGNVTTESGAYTSGTPDWDSARDPLNPDPTLTPHPRETILDGNDLSGYWESIKNTMQRVNQVDVPYNPLSSNSNAAVDEALREAQLPSPALDGPENYWSPGSDYDLPGGNVQGVADADKVWSDFQRWLNNNDRLQDFTDQIDEGVRETLLDLSRWLQNSPSKIDQIFREAVSIAARDPLAIDLDGDQIETVAINPAAPILFDHNGDGIKTSTGWLKGDDAWLVHDINNNGTIDSGKELLGVDTDITIGGITRKAASGFEALAALDGNGDHVFNADDAAFTTLRLWQDLNQNGISEANELSTLASKGIISIDLTYTSANENLGGGNSITGKATVTRTTGTTELDSVIVTNDSAANLNLADNPFYSELPSVPVTNTAGELPEMRGSGMVNSLRQAMSLDTGAATALSTTVAAFAQGQTRDAQMAVLDNLLQQWGATSSFVTSSPFLGGDGITQTGYNASLPHAAAIKTFAEQNPTLFAKIITLERFNGTNALTQLIGRWGANLPGQVTAALEASYKALQDSVYYGLAAQTRLKSYFDAISVEVTSASIEFSSSGVTALLNSLKQSDERAAMLDLVDLAHFSNAVFKTVGLDARALLADWLSALPSDSTLHDLNWTELLGRATSGDDFLIGGRPVETINAGLGNDWIYGGLGNDYLLSDLGSDTLHGGGGDDTIRVTNAGSNHIYGGEGKDTIEYGAASSANWIEGGAGNDTISAIEGYHPASQVNTFVGGAGNDFITAYQSADTYIFNRGDGADTIWDYGSVRNGILPSDDTISFGDGISVSDVVFSVGSSGLIIRIKENGVLTNDQITVQNWGDTAYRIEKFVFKTGESLTAQQATELSWVINGTDSANALYGTYDNNTIRGFGGTDTIQDAGGSDFIDGGDGDDTIKDTGAGSNHIYGGEGKDTIEYGAASSANWIEGGAGNDTISAIEGYHPASQVNTFVGGAGNDFITAYQSADTYIFNRGDGADTIWDYGSVRNGILPSDDTISFGDGISVSDVVFSVGSSGLIIRIKENGVLTNDQITVQNWGDTAYRIEKFVFKTGESLTAQQATELSWVINGTDSANALYGTYDNNTIRGFGGTDTIQDAGGSDFIDGGDGDDTIKDTGAGSNHIYGGEGKDTIEYGAASSANWIEGGAGNDTISAIEGYHPASQVNTFVGGAGNDFITAYQSADTYIFNRGDGADTIWDYGSVRNGILPSDDTISFGDGISVSDVVFSVGSSGLIIRIKENGVLTNDQITVQNWNDTAYRIENFVFKDSASMSMATANLLSTAVVMAGDENGNSITGTTSSDIMQGHGGADSISAGEGSDVLFGGAEGDSLFGQAGDDTLYGESGGDTLDGGQGADTMYGGFGDDSYNVDDVGDRVIEAANGGNDTVDTTLSDYVLPDHVENLIMNGKAEVNTASGNALDNYIVGSWIGSNISGLAGNDTIVSYDGNDILDGGLGYDVLEGGSGDDVYYVDQTLMPGDNYVVDEVLEFDAYSGGIDTVYTDIADYVLPANVENLVMSGKSAFGNALNNVITGSDDANQVDSGNGNDQLIGLGGDDWLTGGEGNDIYVGGAGDDMLIDDAGDEHYTWGRGEGYDVISDGGGVDKLQVLDGVAADQIWLRQEGLALELQVIGTSDRLLIEGWFIDPLYQVESFELADGKTLNASNVQSLISAMAAFTPPAMGQTTLTAQQQSQLGQVIATNWV